MKKGFKKEILIFILSLSLLTVASFVFAQGDLGINDFGAATNLGQKPLGQIIAEIVRVFLSVLGVIVLGLILYGGFLWMTSAGDADKIARAKKVIINATIGLAIILSAFGLTQFIITSLERATGTNITGSGGGSGSGGGGLPGNTFVVQGISPQGSIPIRNVVVRMSFNHNVNPATVNNVNINITRAVDNSLVSGDFSVNGSRVDFIPSAFCPPPNNSLNCFDPNVEFNINITDSLMSSNGLSLACGGFNPSCSASFTTGDLIDVSPPTAEVTYPDPGTSVSVNSLVNVTARATDDGGISLVEFFADNSLIPYGSDTPNVVSPLNFDALASWDTTGLSLGNHTLNVSSYDVDSHTTVSSDVGVVVRAEHCFNGLQDFDESGLDCGGIDCGVCSGQACTDNSQCASNSCVGSVCVDTPVITDISPLDGAPGSYVTISGKYFGNSPGTVTFLGATTSADDVVASLASCSNAWSDTSVVVEVPSGAVSGPIQISSAVGSDITNDDRGPLIVDFKVNTTTRPGICQLSPKEGKKGTIFNINGDNFGILKGSSYVQFGNLTATTKSWSNKKIDVLVPVLSSGKNSIQVVVGGIASNALIFNLLPDTANTTPVINYIDPNTGPPSEYITIFGSDFGNEPGLITFEGSGGRIANADINFPASCNIDYWHNNSITVKVPAQFRDNTSTANEITGVRVERLDGQQSNSIDFNINNDTPRPGICGLYPNNGPIGTPVEIHGERLGSNGNVTFYNAVNASFSAWGDTLVTTPVPNGVSTGPVTVTSGGQDSNAVNFTVSDCGETPEICGVSEQCCAGSCIPSTTECTAGPKDGAFVWRLSTGVIPKVPHVLEECSGTKNAPNPSPSPWSLRPGGNSVCVNAVVDVRFDTKLDDTSVIFGGLSGDTISLYQCNGPTGDECSSKVKVALAPTSGVYNVDVDTEGISLIPNTFLFPDTKYQVELATGIAEEAAGATMEQNPNCASGLGYCFEFKTRASTEECQVGSVGIAPINYVSKALESVKYKASVKPKIDQCLVINGSNYSYNWSSSKPSNADITPPATGQNSLIETLSETPPNDPALIRVDMPDYAVNTETALTVNFEDPRIVSKWPDGCLTACVNAGIGVKFNIEMDAASITTPGSFRLYRCNTESCINKVLIPGKVSYTYVYDKSSKIIKQNEAVFTITSGGLDVNTFYRVELDANTIQSTSGVPLLNTLNGQSIFSWDFKTRNDATFCEVNKVDIIPNKKIFTYITETTSFSSVPYGVPDSCNPQGQRLIPVDYNWSWNSGNTSIASLYMGGSLNILPNRNNTCSNQCLNTGTSPNASICGNGIIERGEDCDEGGSGNIDDGIGCSAQCLNEGTVSPDCGNTTVFNCINNSNCSGGQICNSLGQCIDQGEDCDNGKQCQDGSQCNNDSDCVTIGDEVCLPRSFDGCSDKCINEGSILGNSTCGNNDIAAGEDCDDGNNISGDGCSSQCVNEGSVKNIGSCGNGVKELGEDCDDGNVINGDGCSNICLNEGSVFSGSVCGNNVIDFGEDCDDGNVINGDGCSNTCLNEGSGFYQTVNPILSNSICGDGNVDLGEDCDIATPDANIDFIQYAVAEGAGKTNINAMVNSVSGNADVEVMCIYTDDSQCPLGFGVANDNCCYPKAQASNMLPVGNNSCRNSMISFEFNNLMNEDFGNVYIDRERNGVCPAGTKQIDGVWCRAIGASNFDPTTLSSGLISHWSFDNNNVSSGVVNDIIGNYNLTATDLNEVSGEIGEARTFNGSTSKAMTSNFSHGDVVSFSVWVRTLSSSGPGYIIDTQGDGALDSGLGIFTSGNSITIVPDSGTAQAGFNISNISVNDGQWHLITVTKSLSDNYITYFDGVSIDSRTVTLGDISSSNSLAIGSATQGSINFFDGDIDDVRIYNRVLLSAEIEGYYLNERPNNTALKLAKSGVVFNEGDVATKLDDKTLFNYVPTNLLESNTSYRVVLEGFQSSNGVKAEDYSSGWIFSTGPDICKLDEVRLDPDPLIFNSIENNNPQTLIARAYSSRNNLEIAPIPGIYDWSWEWIESEEIDPSVNLVATTDPRIVDVTALPVNGDDYITAQAKVITDVSEEDARLGYNKYVVGQSRVIVFICENPWPSRVEGFPLTDNTLNFSTYYCRDKDGSELLPSAAAIMGLAPSEPDIQREDIFTISGTPEAIGLKVYQNLDHLSPLAWYNYQGFFGITQPVKVDGYEGMRENRTTYINSANTGSLYTNMFVISHTQDASSDIQNIYNQLVDNLKFNINLSNKRVCTVGGNKCSSDMDCDVYNSLDVCDASKDKLIRDTKRLADLNDIKDLLEIYKSLNGTYPSMSVGTFLRGFSTSKWPSWNAVLSNELKSALPVDPLNKFNTGTQEASSFTGEGPIAFWDFNDGTGQQLSDVSGNNYHGRLGSSLTVDASDPQWVTGSKCLSGNCLKFAGDDYIVLTNSTPFAFTNQSFTVEGWVKINNNNNELNPLIGRGNPYNVGGSGWIFGYFNNGKVQLSISNGEARTATNGFNPGLISGTWHHLVASVDRKDGAIKLYFDGKLVSSQIETSLLGGNIDSRSNPNDQFDLIIGGYGAASGPAGYGMKGFIDNVKIYNYILTDEEVNAVYKESKPLLSCNSPFSSETCWDDVNFQYICPVGSHVYNYRYVNPDLFELGVDLEYNNGSGWINSPISSGFTVSGICNSQVQGKSTSCGDGIVGLGEECDSPGVQSSESCSLGAQSGFRNIVCTNSCTWDRSAECKVGSCGDGMVDGLEQCDDGSNNGKYGFCGQNCTWSTSFGCGDGVIQSNELCDNGLLNGQYGQCGWDCQSYAPYCGDGKITNREECEGEFLVADSGGECPPGTELRLPCNSNTCRLIGEGASCVVIGSCGDGSIDYGEECDDGNNSNLDSCTNECKVNVCGDGYLEPSTEICDAGINNGVSCNPKYGLSCNYCSRTCKQITLTGGYCGDGIINGNELCEKSDVPVSCKDGGYADLASTRPSCLDTCKIDFSPCTYTWYRINAGGSNYKDVNGNIWTSDQGYFNAGGNYSVNNPIDNTELDTIYQSERYEVNNPNNLTFTFPVAPGKYTVKLHFAEIWNAIVAPDLRTFDVYIEGNKVLSNFDVYKEAGLYNALVKKFNVDVNDNNLEIKLIHVSSVYAKISGIEIELISYK